MWQELEGAEKLRNYYAHPDVSVPRSITSQQVVDFMKAVTLGIIVPSVQIRRTILAHIYAVYWTIEELMEYVEEFAEELFFKDWPWDNTPYMFYCPFLNVDATRFPNSDDQRQGSTSTAG